MHVSTLSKCVPSVNFSKNAFHSKTGSCAGSEKPAICFALHSHFIDRTKKDLGHGLIPPAPYKAAPWPMLTPKHVLLVLSCADQPADAFDALAFRFHILVLGFLGQKHHWEEKRPAVDPLLLQGQAGQSLSSRQDGRKTAMGTWLAPAHLGPASCCEHIQSTLLPDKST